MERAQLIEALKDYGADIEATLERFMEDTELYEDCLRSFAKDENFFLLAQALNDENYVQAFDAAHTLKGVAANLGLTPLLNATGKIVEALRAKNYRDLNAQYQEIVTQYEVFKRILD